MFILKGNYSTKYYCDCESIIINHNLYTFSGYKISICACKSKPTPKPCHGLEGKLCIQGFDERCGEGGVCIPDHE